MTSEQQAHCDVEGDVQESRSVRMPRHLQPLNRGQPAVGVSSQLRMHRLTLSLRVTEQGGKSQTTQNRCCSSVEPRNYVALVLHHAYNRSTPSRLSTSGTRLSTAPAVCTARRSVKRRHLHCSLLQLPYRLGDVHTVLLGHFPHLPSAVITDQPQGVGSRSPGSPGVVRCFARRRAYLVDAIVELHERLLEVEHCGVHGLLRDRPEARQKCLQPFPAASPVRLGRIRRITALSCSSDGTGVAPGAWPSKLLAALQVLALDPPRRRQTARPSEAPCRHAGRRPSQSLCHEA